MVAVYRSLVILILAFPVMSGSLHAATGLTDLAGNGLDGDGNGSAGGTFVSTFRVNAAPDGVSDDFAVAEDGALLNKTVLANDSDFHGGLSGENNLPLSVELTEVPARAGQFELRTNGTFDYTPQENFNGIDGFKYAVKDSFGATSAEVTVSIQVGAINDAPMVVIDASPLEVYVNEAVYLDGSGSSDVEGDALTFIWRFGDGVTADGSAQIHSYTTPGRFTVTLTASDPQGATGQSEVVVIVLEPDSDALNRKPTAVPSSDPSIGVTPLAVNFDGSASFDPDGNIRSYQWDFDDGQVLIGSFVSRSFSSPGVKSGTLTVFDEQGAKDSAAFQVVVFNSAIDGGGVVGVNEGVLGKAQLAKFRFRSVFNQPGRDSIRLRINNLVVESRDTLVLFVGENRWGRLFPEELSDPLLTFERRGKRAAFSVRSNGALIKAMAKPKGRLDVRILRSEFSDALDLRGAGEDEVRGGDSQLLVRLIHTRANGVVIYYRFDVPIKYTVRVSGPKGNKTPVFIQGRLVK